MKHTTQPPTANFPQVREAARQPSNCAGRCLVRNLDFYREAEEQLLAKGNPCRGGGIHLSPSPSER